jgi:hypothetical protein
MAPAAISQMIHISELKMRVILSRRSRVCGFESVFHEGGSSCCMSFNIRALLMIG